MTKQSSTKFYALAVLTVVGVIVALWLFFSWIGAFQNPKPGNVGICQHTGWKGSGTCGVLPAGSKKKNIGIQNELRNLPITQRNYLLTADAARSDSKNVDNVVLPTADGVRVGIEGQALFTLDGDPNKALSFYKKFYQFSPWTSNGWSSWLDVRFRPILENALREEVGGYNCTDLNPSCVAIKGGAANGTKANANISLIQGRIADQLRQDLKDRLGEEYFVNVQFQLTKVTLPGLQDEIDRYNAAKASQATAQARAEQVKQVAIGERQAAEEKAKGIRALNEAYKNSTTKAQIDAIAALPRNLQTLVLGGSGTGLTKLIK
jgi:regulator of protease activity HflC (stomatin/prohibitin superfamily)